MRVHPLEGHAMCWRSSSRIQSSVGIARVSERIGDWKSRHRGGRPTVPEAIRRLIREISIANALWGAPRINGELLKLGIDIGQTESRVSHGDVSLRSNSRHCSM
jgi:hypothetical protein